MPKKPKNSPQRPLTAALGVLVVLIILISRFVQGGGVDLGTLFSSLSGSATPTTSVSSSSKPGAFDFYVLALSWSPDYCATSGSSDPQQCSIGKKLGFVLHGLWPQYNVGYPSDCSKVQMPADVKAKFATLYPSATLMDHEWTKHGTCTGLAPEAYLTLSQQIKNSVIIPTAYRAPQQPLRVTVGQLKREIVAANAGLGEG